MNNSTFGNQLPEFGREYLLATLEKTAAQQNLTPDNMIGFLLDDDFVILLAAQTSTSREGKPGELTGKPVLHFLSGNAKESWVVVNFAMVAKGLYHMIAAIRKEVRENTNGKSRDEQIITETDLERLAMVATCLTQQFADPPSLGELADMASMSVRNLTKKFKLLYKKTISEFLSEQRMMEAKGLLVKTDLPINEIARKVGYKHFSSFTEAFKRTYHCTARKFRKKMRNTKLPYFFAI